MHQLEGTLRGDAASHLPSRRDPALDGIRGLAILLVVAWHFGLPLIGDSGQTGVTLFFVLSGYLITSILIAELGVAGRLSLRRFYLRRFQRLFPALIAMVAVVTALNIAIGQPAAFERAGVAVTYVANWFAVSSGWLGNLNHVWSLAVEVQFYLLWPLALIAATVWFRWSRRAILVSLCVAILLLAAERSLLLGSSAGPNRLTFGSERIDAILIGCLLALLPERFRPHGWAASLIALASVPLLMVLVNGVDFGFDRDITLMAWASGLFMVGAVGSIPMRRLLAIRPLRFAGRLSYSIYLWHVPVVVWLTPLLLTSPAPHRVVAFSACTIVPAYLSYRFLEQPALISAGGRLSWLALPRLGRPTTEALRNAAEPG